MQPLPPGVVHLPVSSYSLPSTTSADRRWLQNEQEGVVSTYALSVEGVGVFMLAKRRAGTAYRAYTIGQPAADGAWCFRLEAAGGSEGEEHTLTLVSVNHKPDCPAQQEGEGEGGTARLRRGEAGTVPMLRAGIAAAIQLEREGGHVTEDATARFVYFTDNSKVSVQTALDGAGRGRNAWASLADYNMLMYGETWYQRHIGAVPMYDDVQLQLTELNEAVTAPLRADALQLWTTHFRTGARFFPKLEQAFNAAVLSTDPQIPLSARNLALRLRDMLGPAFVITSVASVLAALGCPSVTEQDWKAPVDRVPQAKMTLARIDLQTGAVSGLAQQAGGGCINRSTLRHVRTWSARHA